MIRKLGKLLLEKEIVSKLAFLPVQMKTLIENFYSREIKEIVEYGFDNPVESPDSLIEIKRLIRIKDLKEKRNEREKTE